MVTANRVMAVPKIEMNWPTHSQVNISMPLKFGVAFILTRFDQSLLLCSHPGLAQPTAYFVVHFRGRM